MRRNISLIMKMLQIFKRIDDHQLTQIIRKAIMLKVN